MVSFFDEIPDAGGVQNSKEESRWGLASTRKTKQRVYIYCKANVKGSRSDCSVLLTFTVQSETTYYGGKIVYNYVYICIILNILLDPYPWAPWLFMKKV